VTPETLKAAIREALVEARQADVSEHAEHHAFLAKLIEREELRLRMYEDLRRHLVKWGAIGVLSFIGMAVWYWVRNHI
jgi:hypothetical protein